MSAIGLNFGKCSRNIIIKIQNKIPNEKKIKRIKKLLKYNNSKNFMELSFIFFLPIILLRNSQYLSDCDFLQFIGEKKTHNKNKNDTNNWYISD